MKDLLKCCTLCPRNCRVNRYETIGACGATDKVKVAHYSLHEWEEPVISGEHGSGTIFFSNCNLKCIFCQNNEISELGYGKEISISKLSELYERLEKMGAHNINLVTPTHYVPQIIESLKNKTINIPIVYNTSSYENRETIKLLDGIFDFYLADLKYYDSKLGEKYSHCKNYFEFASNAINEMFKQVGKYKIENNLMKKGLIVRVLILPGHIDDAKKIIKYLYDTYKDDIFISIMNQYTPMKCFEYENLNRKITEEEYNEVVNYACDLGITNAFIQEGDTASISFIPKFNCDSI